MTLLLIATVLVPLLLALVVWLPGKWPLRLGSLAALPALLLAALSTAPLQVEIPWLYLNSTWGVDPLGRIFLALTAILWLACGIFAHGYHAHDPHQRRFFFFFLLAMAGNLGLTIALDVSSFLSAFAVMSFASYGLIVHQARASDRHAGRVYLSLVVTGEVLLVSGVAWLVAAGASTDFGSLRETMAAVDQPLLYLLFLAGFGIKLGLLPLHIWLPLAHPAAPTAASAVLSGSMIKAGLLGLLRVFPLGETALPWLGEPLVVIGLTAALGAAIVGMTHAHPKVVLAYSSISQMGLVTVALGCAMILPDDHAPLLLAIGILAGHHALAKAALFLGVGVADCTWQSQRARNLVGGMLALPGLALAGLPLTSGLLAKSALKEAVGVEWVMPYLMATGLTTTLLVARYLVVVWPRAGKGHHQPDARLVVPTLVLILLGLALPWVALQSGWVDSSLYKLYPMKLVKASWAILLAAVIAWRFWRHPAWDKPMHLPAGDLGVLVVWGTKRLITLWRHSIEPLAEAVREFWRGFRRLLGLSTTGSLGWIAPRVESWQNVGLAVVILGLVIFVLLT